jgi:hypothetical protein
VFHRIDEETEPTDEEFEDADRRPDMWIQLARGFTVEQIFPNLEDLGMVRRDGPLQ